MGKVTCGHPDRKNYSRGNCKQCAQKVYSQRRMQTVQEKRKHTPPERINQETELTHTLRLILAILVAELLPRQKVCQGHGKIAGCTGKPTEVHHGKGRDGFRIILSIYFKYLCNNCHGFCTENSAQAISIGLSYRRNTPTDWSFTKRELELIKEFGLDVPKYACN